MFVWREVGGARGARAAGLAGLRESGIFWCTVVGAAAERRRIVLRASLGVAKDARGSGWRVVRVWRVIGNSDSGGCRGGRGGGRNQMYGPRPRFRCLHGEATPDSEQRATVEESPGRAFPSSVATSCKGPSPAFACTSRAPRPGRTRRRAAEGAEPRRESRR